MVHSGCISVLCIELGGIDSVAGVQANHSFLQLPSQKFVFRFLAFYGMQVEGPYNVGFLKYYMVSVVLICV